MRNTGAPAQESSRSGPAVEHRVQTSSPQAQRLFDRGLTLIYALDYSDAAKSFEHAAAVDPNMAMSYWGIAYTAGSDYYYATPGDPKRESRAREALRRASILKQVPEPERAYLAALGKRYCNCENPDRHQLAIEYADAMHDLTEKYPDDLDAATLYAQALMNLSPEGLWNSDGTPVKKTPEIVSVLESVLKRNPRHMGAIHYYIHVMEASPEPERAITYAQVLPSLASSIGHIVHMPAHIYIRTGDYAKAETACRNAALVDENEIQHSAKPAMFTVMSYLHDLYFLASAASIAGDYPSALKAATDLATSVAPYVEEMPDLQSFLMVQTEVAVRFNRWGAILKMPSPQANLKIATAMWHYGRGVAFAATMKVPEARAEQEALQETAASVSPGESFSMSSRNGAREILRIASDALGAKIAMATSDKQQAISQLRDAVAIQDGLLYSEPPTWFYPVRESLGAVLFSAGRISAAEEIFREDLRRNPRNPRSLFGLLQALRSSGNSSNASLVQAQLNTSWKGDLRQLDLSSF